MVTYTGNSGERLYIENITPINKDTIKEFESNDLSILWFSKDGNHLKIDGIDYSFNKNHIVCLTEFHKIEVLKISDARLIRFSRSFYCILHHDVEVSCKGVLFFGASQLPIITIPKKELEILETVFKMFTLEFEHQDNLQMDMLQMMLKRFLIICTRIYKSQEKIDNLSTKQTDIVREFNFLVEQHFRKIHSVKEYAQMLYKSPKTLSNIFSKFSDKTPLQFIHERRSLEAKRLLQYSEKSIKEIAYELGFEDLQTFGRFFKKTEGITASEFRNMK